jgi:hypothetical protein
MSQREITLLADLPAIHIRPIARGNSIIAQTFVSVGETFCVVSTRRDVVVVTEGRNVSDVNPARERKPWQSSLTMLSGGM